MPHLDIDASRRTANPQDAYRPTAMLGALLAAILGEALFYPSLATWFYKFFSRRGGWDGSGLRYVQVTLVAPVGFAMGLAVLIVIIRARHRGERVATRIVATFWFLNVLLLALSIWRYASLADRG